ncbi:MAG: CDP-glycerol glycerophosphotransferase family protein [Erysipelotrichaceae bacterium]|nr:CDP-glycerol glycerophosphotransferase family protein [Erysipelotrichaceae bacterium]
MGKQYLFTIIITCNDGHRHLKQTVNSLLRQTIGAERVQMIAVSDGSLKGTKALKRHAAEHSGSLLFISDGGNGRNEALRHAEGEYVGFLDCRDKLAGDCLKRVWDFCEMHHDETDVVCVPVYLFDGADDPDPQNFKFAQGSRVIDLTRQWDNAETRLNCCFIRREALTAIRPLEESLTNDDDFPCLYRLFLEKPRLGVVAGTSYRRRYEEDGRTVDFDSPFRNDPKWYLDTIRKHYRPIIKLCHEKKGEVPLFVQYALAGQLSRRLSQSAFPEDVLSEDDQRQFLAECRQLLSELDSEVIAALRNSDTAVKLSMLRCRPGKAAAETDADGVPWITFNGLKLCKLSDDVQLRADFMSVQEGNCLLEGRCYSCLDVLPKVTVLAGETRYEAEVRPDQSTSCLLEAENHFASSYRVCFPVHDRDICRLAVSLDGQELQPGELTYGKFMPMRKKFPDMYSLQDGWLIRRDGSAITFRKNSFLRHCLYERRFQKNITSPKRVRDEGLRRSARKACLIRPLAMLVRRLPHKETWLFRDRNYVADDNGLVMYKYVRDNHPEINAVFAIMKKTAQYAEIGAKGKVVDSFSKKYRWLFLISRYVISSAADEDIINPFQETYEFYMDLMPYCHYIFLQHGVTKDDLSGWLKRYNKNLTGIITSSRREYESFLAPSYGYPAERIWLTGMPRFDRLIDEKKKLITIAPTWRRYLVGHRDKAGHYESTDILKNSSYIRHLQSLAGNQKLLDTAEKYGYRVQLVIHPNMRNHAHLIKPDKRMEMVMDISYNRIFRESALLVSDYSSVVFDFAYLYKPVIYYQFDRDVFFSHHTYVPGYFSYEDDGFGEVVDNEEELVSLICGYMASDCRMKEKYVQRVNDFFAFHDGNCCKRVYEKLTERN